MSRAALRAWLSSAARTVGRDPLLLQLLVAPAALVVLLRMLDGTLGAWVTRTTGLALAPYRPLLTSFLLLLLVPFLSGLLAGLVLLDERDEGVLTALRVTPLGLGGYALLRAGTTAALSLGTLLVAVPLAGSHPDGAPLGALPVLVLAALFAPLPALALATFATNKVEGLALVKGASLLLFTPLLGWFAESRWSLLLGVIPTYWPARAFWQWVAGEPAWPFWGFGLAYHAALLVLLMRAWSARAHAAAVHADDSIGTGGTSHRRLRS